MRSNTREDMAAPLRQRAGRSSHAQVCKERRRAVTASRLKGCTSSLARGDLHGQETLSSPQPWLRFVWRCAMLCIGQPCPVRYVRLPLDAMRCSAADCSQIWLQPRGLVCRCWLDQRVANCFQVTASRSALTAADCKLVAWRLVRGRRKIVEGRRK